MRNLIPLLALLLTSCASGRTIFVWNMKDLIGLYFFAGIILVVSLFLLYLWAEDKFYNWQKRKKRKNKL